LSQSLLEGNYGRRLRRWQVAKFVHDQELRFSEVHEPVLESTFRMPSLTAVGIVVLALFTVRITMENLRKLTDFVTRAYPLLMESRADTL
jgi:hypothetical protein